MSNRYQVIAECAHATVNHPLYGRTQQLLLKGALVPAEAPELEHLLSVGMVAEVGDDATGGVNADGVPSGALEVQVPSGVTSTPVEVSEEAREAAARDKAVAEVEERRAAAKAKLPEDGSLPDGRAGKDVWVEWLASKGYDFDELIKQEPAELKALAKNA
jgi:hypothetical protein